jgi:YidC/Oxa1 family membrane protein insertase
MSMQAQTRNWILFFLSFVVIIVGFPWIKNHFWPPAWQPSREDRIVGEQVVRMVTSITGTGVGDIAQLGTQAGVNYTGAKEYALATAQEKIEKDKQAAAKAAEKARPSKPAQPAKPAELITLGGDEYYLKVDLTNRGAGVHDLTLMPFKAADDLGLPKKGPDGKPLNLRLIPPSDETSFALYHYASDDKSEERPLDTLGNRDWQIVEQNLKGEEQRLVFATELPDFGVRLTKTFSLRPREYHLGLDVKIERLPGAKDVKPFRYQLVGGHGVPIEGVWYTTIFRNVFFDWVDANGIDKRNQFDSRTIGLGGGTDRIQRTGPRLQYAAVANQYFTSAIVVSEDQPKRDFVEFVRATVEDEPEPTKQQLDDITARVIAEPVDPKPGDAVEHKYLLYHGPVKVALLERMRGEGAISAELTQRYKDTLHLRTLTDYGNFGWWSDFIIFFTNAVHWLIGVLRPICIYDGICIVVVTVLVRLAMMPVSRRQQGSMARTQEAMAKLKPEIAKLQERYKNDLVAKQQAQMELYRKHGVNPAAGLGGCLMLVLQMPIFLGLYFALQESFFFRLEPFLWIRNLAAPDMLFWWSERVPYISDPSHMGSFFYLGPYFNLLPILSLTLMFLQMRFMQPPPADEQMAQQQKMTQYIMIPMFAFLFYKMPSGLCLYFISTTLWGLIERKWFIKKKPASPAAAPAGDNGRPGPRGKGKGKNQPEPPPPGKFKAWWEKVLKEAQKK